MTTMHDAPNRRRDRNPVSGHAGSGGGETYVGVFKARYRTQRRCSCGWIGTARLFEGWAKIDALIHAAQNDCRPTAPLVQSGGVFTMSPLHPGVQGKRPTVVEGSCQR